MHNTLSKVFLTAMIAVLGFVAGCEQKADDPSSAGTPAETAPAPEDPAAGAYEALTEGGEQATANDTAMPAEESSPAGAVAQLAPVSGSSVSGTVNFTAEPATGGLTLDITLAGLTPGSHGFHIHENGDCSAEDGTSAGGHYNPTDVDHGAPTDEVHHVGDMGNIVADENGSVDTKMVMNDLVLSGENSIIGKAVIVHGGEDDLTSQPSGDAGPRVACGVIAEKPGEPDTAAPEASGMESGTGDSAREMDEGAETATPSENMGGDTANEMDSDQ